MSITSLTRAGNAADGFFEHNVGANVNDAQFGANEQHADALGFGAFGEQFGVAGVAKASGKYGFFVERRGDNCCNIARHGKVARAEDVVNCGFARQRIDLPNRDFCRIRISEVEQGDCAG